MTEKQWQTETGGGGWVSSSMHHCSPKYRKSYKDHSVTNHIGTSGFFQANNQESLDEILVATNVECFLKRDETGGGNGI